ncbi:hypothetical protein AFK68_23470, partial [Hydrocoleum sp. CS-953]
MWHEYLWLKLRKVVRGKLGSRPLAQNNALILSTRQKTATRQIVKILIIACLIPLLFLIVPAWGQATDNSLETAPVELNGKELFKVAGNEEENLTPTKRAEIISSKLENILDSGKSIKVNIDNQNQQTILLINNDNLLTITAADVKAGINTEEQAAIWKYNIEDGFESAKKDIQSPNLFKVLLISIFLILAAVVLEFFLRWLQLKINIICEEKYPQIVNYLPRFLPFMAIFIRVIVGIVVILYLTSIIPFTRDYHNKLLEILGELSNSFTSDILNLGEEGFSIIEVVTLIGLTIGMWKGVGYFIDNIFRTKIISLTGAERSVQDTISFLTKYGLIFLGILIILQIWNIDISSLAIIASVLGVGIGFGLQIIANNFISDIILVFDRLIQVASLIHVEILVVLVV